MNNFINFLFSPLTPIIAILIYVCMYIFMIILFIKWDKEFKKHDTDIEKLKEDLDDGS